MKMNKKFGDKVPLSDLKEGDLFYDEVCSSYFKVESILKGRAHQVDVKNVETGKEISYLFPKEFKWEVTKVKIKNDTNS